MDTLRIRAARPDDAPALLEIYAPYVRDTAITFEIDVPSQAEFRRRIEATLARYPYLVLEGDGAPLGYAYTGPFKSRAAYDWAVETSLYLRADARGRGLGARLHAALEAASRAQGVQNLCACVTWPRVEDGTLTLASVRFHEKLGYRVVGRFDRCGYKFGRWYDMAWLEKHIGAHEADPAPLRPFPDVDFPWKNYR